MKPSGWLDIFGESRTKHLLIKRSMLSMLFSVFSFLFFFPVSVIFALSLFCFLFPWVGWLGGGAKFGGMIYLVLFLFSMQEQLTVLSLICLLSVTTPF